MGDSDSDDDLVIVSGEAEEGAAKERKKLLWEEEQKRRRDRDEEMARKRKRDDEKADELRKRETEKTEAQKKKSQEEERRRELHRQKEKVCVLYASRLKKSRKERTWHQTSEEDGPRFKESEQESNAERGAGAKTSVPSGLAAAAIARSSHGLLPAPGGPPVPLEWSRRQR
jgi:hypothetical protein